MKSAEINTIDVTTRADWRQWLADNHATETGVWLRIYTKNSGTPSVTYDEAVDEALCFGWIDGSARKGDTRYYLRLFTRRGPKSTWSRVNKNKVEKLLAAGLMTEAGRAVIDRATQTGTWTALDEVEEGIIPPDLQTALDANPTARACFGNFPRSAKRALLEWLLTAKTTGTRTRRVEEIVTRAARNERANLYVRKA